MGEYTGRDWHRLQQRGATALASVLAYGYRMGLPAVAWTLNTMGDLVADVHGLTVTAADQRAAFDVWCDYLAADRWRERTDSDGMTYLHAVFTWRDDPRVKGAVRAVIFPADDGRSA
ncbi:hypothetical protein [Streptomyces sp. CA2R106]|uniref:hypothetical protein n=1 Tax=Streptomyces sp. CA2R106 TaxID=3120153 RepID=UPI0030094353